MKSVALDVERLPEGMRPDDRVLVFDGVCELCNGWVHFVIARDPESRLRLCALQSEAGARILELGGLSQGECDTMVFVEGRQLHFKSTAFLKAARHLTAPWRWLGVWIVAPAFVRNFFYDRVAKNRLAIFGEKDACMMPTPEIRARFLA